MSKLEITSIRIHRRPKAENSNIVGVASVVLNNAFLINDIKIIQTDKKMFCGMPSKRLEDNSFVDVCNPLNTEVRKYIEGAILAEFINTPEEVTNE